jgi:DNA-dependent protein kinase catalytic subunit
LTISAENYIFERDSAGERRKAEFIKLKREIASPLKEDFIFELRRLTNPEHLLKDWLEQTLVCAWTCMRYLNDLFQLRY